MEDRNVNCDDPNCPCREHRRRVRPRECSLTKPLYMVIPPEGTHISCPVHGQHFIIGPPAVWMSSACR